MTAGLFFPARTLGRYLLRRFVLSITAVILTFFALIYTGDLIELMRRAGDAQHASTAALARLSLLRVPAVTEQVFPFAVLFGSLAAFLDLSRRLELVVARATGVSAWQFITPGLIAGFALGLFTMMVYNPVAVKLKNRADEIESRLFERTDAAPASNSLWFDQKAGDDTVILQARNAAGLKLFNVTAFISDRDGHFKERIESPTAELQKGYWLFSDGRIVSQGKEPRSFESYELPSNLTADEFSSSIGSSESVSFWALPGVVRRLELAGLDTTRYRLTYQTLLARPALLVAMILVAASVSLRFFRFGGIARMVLGGVAGGFFLYVVTKVAENLGSSGMISAVAAAWSPAILGGLMGILTLLYLEDG